MSTQHTPIIQEAFDLLNDSRVRHYIGQKLGEMSRLHSVLNVLRIRGAVEQYDAAPELLEALEGMLEQFDHPGLRGLILKASKHGWTQEHLDAHNRATSAAQAAIAKARGS